MTLIAQIADIHFGAEDDSAIADAEACIKEARPDMLVVCGDLTQRGRTREFDAAADWLDRFDLPKLIVPGNHDTPMFNLAARAAEPPPLPPRPQGGVLSSAGRGRGPG